MNSSIIFPCEYSQISRTSRNVFLLARNYQKDLAQTEIPPQPEGKKEKVEKVFLKENINSNDAHSLEENFSAIEMQTKYLKSYTDKDYVQLIKDNNLYGLIDHLGQTILPAEYTFIEYIGDGYFIIKNTIGFTGLIKVYL